MPEHCKLLASPSTPVGFSTGVLTIGEAYYRATGCSVSVWVSLLTSHVMTSLESLPGRRALRHRSAQR